jgi:hypothetical protein
MEQKDRQAIALNGAATPPGGILQTHKSGKEQLQNERKN